MAFDFTGALGKNAGLPRIQFLLPHIQERVQMSKGWQV